MSLYEARATLALFTAEHQVGPSNANLHLHVALGRLVQAGTADILGVLEATPPLTDNAPSFEAWRDRADPARDAAIAKRVTLQERFEPFAPFVADLTLRVATSAPLPPGVTKLHEGEFARVYRFTYENSGEEFVAKISKKKNAASQAADLEHRISGLIPAVGGAGLEQGLAFSYDGAAIARFAPGEALEDMELSRVAQIGEGEIDFALDVADDAERRGIIFDATGDKNILFDIGKANEEIPVWFLDFWAQGPKDRLDKNVSALVLAFWRAGWFGNTVSIAERRRVIDPILEYMATSCESRHPDRPEIVGRIRDLIG